MIIWLGFIALVMVFLALDLGVFNRKAHVIGTREALAWTSVWILVSLAFSVFVYYAYENHWDGLGLMASSGELLDGKSAVMKYLTGYVVEKALSIDNIFVIAIIFAYFKVPQLYQHRVLFWGILGALMFRGLMIFAGVYLLEQFSWMSYVFGVILLYSAYKMLRSGDEELDPDNNPVVNFAKRFIPVTRRMKGEQFFVRRGNFVAATPLFIALIVVETTDVMFAFDSIPAIFAITTDPFIVFTSNIFAILGLRSMYFVLASVLDKFKYLQFSLVLILAFVGVKMLLLHHVHLPEWLSLTVILGLLGGGVTASLLWPPKE